LSWYHREILSARVETRTRIFTGPLVREIPVLKEILDVDNGITSLTFTDMVSDHTIFNTMIDRAFLGFRNKKWDITLGRQRINWGMNTIWNPNDLFNAYNFFDFDYEERPGSDALRVQYTTGDFSFIESAVSKGHDKDDLIYAMIYRFNTSGYDIQLIGGSVRERVAVGIGWAGNIKDAGFKGEITWFDKQAGEPDGEFLLSSGLDYTLNPGWYLNLAYLYNSTYEYGSVPQEGFSSSFNNERFPYQHAMMMQVMKEISLVWNVGMSAVYSNDENLAFIPTISYSISQNLEAMLYGQIFQSIEIPENNSVSGIFRIKWSF
jgi:hypothetical protein